MNYTEKLLLPDERVVRTARDHWATLLVTILADVALAVVVVGLSAAGMSLLSPWTGLVFLLLIVPIVHFLFRMWRWWNKQYIVTNRRLIQITGTFNKRVSDTLLEKINDIVMEQSALGRMLNFGDVEVISGSESGIDTFRRLTDPIEFKKALLDQKASFDRLGAFEERAEQVLSAQVPDAGGVPELIAELDELRQRGSITDTEFEEKKQQLLDRI